MLAIMVCLIYPISCTVFPFLQVNQIIYELQLKKLPKLCVYGTKDTFTDQSIQNKTAAKFGLGQEQFDMYNDDNQIIQKG